MHRWCINMSNEKMKNKRNWFYEIINHHFKINWHFEWKMKHIGLTLFTDPITAPMSWPIITTEFDPRDLINCNSSSHILCGVYSLRHCGLSESLKPFKSSATTRKNLDSSLI